MGAACDGDGDRNMILGRNFFVSPGDSLAIIAEHAPACIPGYREGLAGVAGPCRPAPRWIAWREASAFPARDSHRLEVLRQPDGCGDVHLCAGRELRHRFQSRARKGRHWAVLSWLSILAAKRKSLSEVVREHWQRFGRSYYQRHDYEGLDAGIAAGDD